MCANLKIIRVRADLGAASKINEFQSWNCRAFVSDANHKMAFHRNALQNLLKDPQPVSAQDLFDLFVAKAAFDEFSSQISRVGMVR